MASTLMMGLLRSSTSATSAQIIASPKTATFQQTVRGMATKKQGGSSSNGRDSAGRRLGIKLYPGMYAKAGAIVVRQRGAKFRPGANVGIGRDHTIYATQPGMVTMTRHPYHKKKRHIVHIVQEEGEAVVRAEASSTTATTVVSAADIAA